MEVHRLQDRMHSFRLSEVCQPRTSQERVATVDASKYKRSKKCFDGIISEVVANIATTSDSWKSCYTNEMDVFFHRVLSCVLELDNMTIYEVSK